MESKGRLVVFMMYNMMENLMHMRLIGKRISRMLFSFMHEVIVCDSCILIWWIFFFLHWFESVMRAFYQIDIQV